MAPKASPKPRLTHFLCVPLVTASSASRWRASLDKFIADAAGNQQGSESSRPSIPAKAIRPLHSLHLTLGVMSLESAESVEDAARALQEADVKGMLAEIKGHMTTVEEMGREQDQSRPNTSISITNTTSNTDSETTTPPPSNLNSTSTSASTATTANQPQPLHLTLRSLHPMHSPSRTSILYASPEDPTNRLFPFCSQLRDHFTARSLLVPDDRPLKLHATIVNTLYARSDTRKAARKLPKGWGRPAAAKSNPSTSATADPNHAGAEGSTAADADVMDRNGRIDARDLIERWDGFVWAEVVLDRVAICEMGAKPDERGEVRYKEVAVAEL